MVVKTNKQKNQTQIFFIFLFAFSSLDLDDQKDWVALMVKIINRFGKNISFTCLNAACS